MSNPFKRKETDVNGKDSQLKEKNERLEQEIVDLKKKHFEEINEYNRKQIEYIDKLENEEMKSMQLLLRLSKLASEQLTKDNPAITNLSDTNRPTRLGEIYSELYDNEWTDALDGLMGAGHGVEEAIATLYLTLLNVYDFCKKKAETMLTKTDDAVNYLFEEYKLLHDNKKESVTRMSLKRISGITKASFEENSTDDTDLKQRWMYKKGHKPDKKTNCASVMIHRSEKIFDKLKVFQKEVAEIMVPVVQKAYLKASCLDEECVPELKPFIRKCIFVCWIMAVQSPPMTIHTVDLMEQNRFDPNLYKEYTYSGPLVEYIVWPAMLLHENGSVVCKGIVQCCKPDYNLNIPESASVC